MVTFILKVIDLLHTFKDLLAFWAETSVKLSKLDDSL